MCRERRQSAGLLRLILAIDILNRKWKEPRFCTGLVRETRKYEARMNFVEYRHVFREVNVAADYLASLAEPYEECKFL